MKTGQSIEFNPTNSMCVDATVANMHSAGCVAVSVEKGEYGVTEIYCHEYAGPPTESTWIHNTFYGIAFGSRIPSDVRPICTDPFLIMTMGPRTVAP